MDWNSKGYKRLIGAFIALDSEIEASHFLRDLMTEKEIKEFSNRFKAAEMLADAITYTIIEKETGLSSTTIARVAKWLNSTEGGYRSIINKLHHNDYIHPQRRLS